MRLNEYNHNWPPEITNRNSNFMAEANVPAQAELDDVVIKVQNRVPGELGIWLRPIQYGSEYTGVLSVPTCFQQQIIFDIFRKKNMSLREIGELELPTGLHLHDSSLKNSQSNIIPMPVEHCGNWLYRKLRRAILLATTARSSVPLRVEREGASIR